MKKIKMRSDCDCMVACLAMLLNCTYKEAAEYFPPKAIKETGYRWEWLVPYLSRCGINLIWFGENFYSLCDSTKPAMIEVPSLTSTKGNHVIFWNGKKIIDPSNKKLKYKEFPKFIYNIYQLKN